MTEPFDLALKTKADRDYLIRIYNLAKPGVYFDCKQVTRTPDGLKHFKRLILHEYISNKSSDGFYLTKLGLKAAQVAEELADQEAETAADQACQQSTQALQSALLAVFETILAFLANLFGKH